MSRRTDSLAAALTGLLVALVAAACRAPDVLFADAGELITAVAVKGMAHPPGFPLYLLAGGLWLDVTPALGLSVASRLNLFSSICDGLAAGFIVLASTRLARRVGLVSTGVAGIVPAVLAGLLAGFGPTLFDFSLGVEVYAIHAVFLAAALALAISAGAEDDPADRRLKTVLCGVAAGCGLGVHHATMVVILPGLAVLLWAPGTEARADRLRRVGLFSLGLVPGLLTYVLLPLRARRGPDLNWGNPGDLRRFWVHLSAKDYQVNIESSAPVILEHAGRFLEAYRLEFTLVGLLLAFAAAARFLRAGRLVGLGLLVAIAGDIAFAVRYEIAEDQAAYYIPTFLVTALLCGLGVGWLASLLRSRRPVLGHVGLGVAGLLTLALVVRNVSAHRRQNDLRPPEAVANVLDALPPNALCFTPEWNLYAPVMAARLVDGDRKDVQMLDVLLLRRGWYLDSWKARNPALYQEIATDFDTYRAKLGSWEEGRPYDPNELTRLYDGLTQRLTQAAWKKGMPVVWIGTLMTEHLPKGTALVPAGLGYRAFPSQQDAAEYVEEPRLRLDAALTPGLAEDQVFEEKIRPMYTGMLLQRAFYEMAFRNGTKMEALVDRARALSPGSAEAAEVKADFLVGKGDLDGALELYADALRFGGDRGRIGGKSREVMEKRATPSRQKP